MAGDVVTGLTLIYQTPSGADRVIGGSESDIWNHMRKLRCDATVYDLQNNIIGRVERAGSGVDDRRVKWLRWLEREEANMCRRVGSFEILPAEGR